jgi:lysophospholipase L1-like esterase
MQDSTLATPPETPYRPSRRVRAVTVGDPPRRTMSAGHVLVVAVIALGLGSLLNAQGLRKGAEVQDGWRRDVGVALTRPLAAVSSALQLDEPRAALKRALGRGDDDRLRTGVSFTAPVEGRVSTGLERPELYDWYERIRKQLRRERPDAVVLSFGANDDHDYMSGLPAGVSIGDFGSETWTAEYRRRAAAVMDLVARDGRLLFWIGLPITSDPAQSARFDVINRIVHDEAAKRQRRVFYVDTYTLFAGEDGGYAQYLPDATGGLLKVRMGDGVHFERAGGNIIAAAVLAKLRTAVELR